MVLFMPNYLSFSCAYFFILALLGLLDPIRIRNADPDPCVSGSETLMLSKKINEIFKGQSHEILTAL
jgi:hypothetical protein